MEFNFEQEFKKIMNTAQAVALATSIDNMPNVRIVNFVYDETTPGIIYFASFPDNQKVIEFEKNNNVSFTSIPDGSIGHVRAKGTVTKSARTLMDMADMFVAKIPYYDETIQAVGNILALYEIKFDKAGVIVDMQNAGAVNF